MVRTGFEKDMLLVMSCTCSSLHLSTQKSVKTHFFVSICAYFATLDTVNVLGILSLRIVGDNDADLSFNNVTNCPKPRKTKPRIPHMYLCLILCLIQCTPPHGEISDAVHCGY